MKKKLTVWTIALINVAAICNIKNFPLMAEYGFATIFYLLISALLFFIPVSFVSAELASGWPDRGVYTWIREAMGPRWGFLAIWLQWVSNVIWYPTILSFIAATFAYLFNPDLAEHKTYILVVILITFWSATFVNFLGIRVSGAISSVSALFGTILPIGLIILFGLMWVLNGHHSHVTFTWDSAIPDFSSFQELVLLIGFLLGLAGMEMSAVHAKDVKNPRKDYPIAILLSAILILVLSAMGALSIAVVVPTEKIQLASGSMEAFTALFKAFGMPWAIPVIAAIMTLGALGQMSTWIVGPSRGLLATAQHGDLPPIFQKTNKNNMPISIFLVQAALVTVLSFVFLFMPSVSSSYWILIAMAAELYLIMYILMFISGIILRYKSPHVKRDYKIPGNNAGMWIVSSFGILGSALAIVVGLFPPTQLETGNPLIYELFLAGGVIFFCVVPFIIYAMRKPHWKTEELKDIDESR